MLFLRNARSTIHNVLLTQLPKYELNNDNTNRHANVDRESLSPTQRTTGNGEELSTGLLWNDLLVHYKDLSLKSV